MIAPLSILNYLIILSKEKLTDFIDQTFNREGSLYLACNEKRAFSLLNNLKNLNCCNVRKFVTLSIILRTLYLFFGSKLCRQIVGIPMGTYCATLVLELFFILLLSGTSCFLFLTTIKQMLLKH